MLKKNLTPLDEGKKILKPEVWPKRIGLYVSGELPTYPSPKPTLGEGYVDSFPETYKDPNILTQTKLPIPPPPQKFKNGRP